MGQVSVFSYVGLGGFVHGGTFVESVPQLSGVIFREGVRCRNKGVEATEPELPGGGVAGAALCVLAVVLT